jgi:hypothetical protein
VCELLGLTEGLNPISTSSLKSAFSLGSPTSKIRMTVMTPVCQGFSED